MDDLQKKLEDLERRIAKIEKFLNETTEFEDYFRQEEVIENLFEQAVVVVCEHKIASTGILQRRLQIGFNKAVKIMVILEEEGIIGSADGAKPREVLIKNPQQYFDKLKKN